MDSDDCLSVVLLIVIKPIELDLSSVSGFILLYSEFQQIWSVALWLWLTLPAVVLIPAK